MTWCACAWGRQEQFPEDASWAVAQATRAARVPVTEESDDDAVGFRTAKLHVAVHKDPFALTVTDMQGNVLAVADAGEAD